MILIGSRAIQHWFPDFPREPKDTDYIVKLLPPTREKGIEYLLNPILDDYDGDILDPDTLLTLKISHLFWDIKWSKHMFDVQFLLGKGCFLNKPLFYKLYSLWNLVHGKNRRSNLQMSAEDFFDNALKDYDHDYLHTLLNESPTYKKVLKNDAEIDVDENKFRALSHHEKYELVREEVYVMAFERMGTMHWREAYDWMLKKFIMNHAPLWEAFFIIENYIELHKPTFNYKQKLDYELSRNLVSR